MAGWFVFEKSTHTKARSFGWGVASAATDRSGSRLRAVCGNADDHDFDLRGRLWGWVGDEGLGRLELQRVLVSPEPKIVTQRLSLLPSSAKAMPTAIQLGLSRFARCPGLDMNAACARVTLPKL